MVFRTLANTSITMAGARTRLLLPSFCHARFLGARACTAAVCQPESCLFSSVSAWQLSAWIETDSRAAGLLLIPAASLGRLSVRLPAGCQTGGAGGGGKVRAGAPAAMARDSSSRAGYEVRSAGGRNGSAVAARCSGESGGAPAAAAVAEAAEMACLAGMRWCHQKSASACAAQGWGSNLISALVHSSYCRREWNSQAKGVYWFRRERDSQTRGFYWFSDWNIHHIVGEIAMHRPRKRLLEHSS